MVNLEVRIRVPRAGCRQELISKAVSGRCSRMHAKCVRACVSVRVREQGRNTSAAVRQQEISNQQQVYVS